MMQLRLGLVLAVSALSLAGCGRFALNNHSLDYKKQSNSPRLSTLPMQLYDQRLLCILHQQ